ncbi:MAG: hypothetical protein Q8P02_04410, partial [Candidatus Micrarchaeota archaeon]|nr:hypothetical protein [Candidatus Micrarchaeota archaeon]
AAAEAAQDTTVRAVDENGNALSMHAKVLKVPAVELAEFYGDVWELKVVPGDYYLWVSAEGHLAATEKLVAGKNHVITLKKASAFNAAIFTVTVRDEYGSALSGAGTFLMRDGRLLTDALETDGQGKATFSGVPLGDVTAVAAFAGISANTTAKVEIGGSATTITLSIHRAVLNVSVHDATNGAPVQAGVHIETALGSADCQNAACAFQVPAQTEIRISVSAPGFATEIKSVVLSDNENRAMDVALLPDAATRGTAVSILSVRNATGQTAPTLTPGQEYVLAFNLSAAPSAESQTMHFRVGQDARIIEHTDADRVNQSTEFSASCDDLLPEYTYDENGYRWMALGFDEAAQRELFFVIRVNPSAKSNQVLTIDFATSTTTGIVTATDPVDAELRDCNPRTHQVTLPIAGSAAPGTGGGGNGGTPSPTPNPFTVPGTTNPLPQGKYFTPEVGIAYNPATGKVEADVDEIVLQVDPIYPRDTVPLRINQERCSIAASIQSSQPRCYSLSESALTFRTREFESACDSHVSANRVVLVQDQPALVLQAICAGAESRTVVPIRIEAQEAQSISTAPQQLDQGQETAKLLYAINQLQAGTRTLIPSGAPGTVTVGAASATALSWSGPGTLTLLEGDQGIGEWTYESGTTFFSGIGTVGQRVDGASDYLSCGQGWCTAKAALQAISFFKKEAQKTALATAFRRADVPLTDFPQATITPTPSPSPSPSPDPVASASPTPPETGQEQILHLDETVSAQNGVSAQLVGVGPGTNGIVASFFIKNNQGAIVDGADVAVGATYQDNGIVLSVTALDEAAGTATVTIAAGTASTAPQSVSDIADSAAEPFTFSTILQLGQDADKALAVADFDVRRAPGCSAGQPAVFLTQATTTDGKTFTYQATTMTLTQNLDAPGNQVALCGFLYADKKVIQGAPPIATGTGGTGSIGQPGSTIGGPQQPGFNPLWLASLINPSIMSLLNPETTGNPLAVDSHFVQAQSLAEQCRTLSKNVEDKAKSCPRWDALVSDRKDGDGSKS